MLLYCDDRVLFTAVLVAQYDFTVTRDTIFSVKINASRDGPEKKYRDKEGMKAQKDHPAA